MTRAASVYEMRLSEALVNAIGARLREAVYEAGAELRLAERAAWGVEGRLAAWQECCARLDEFVDARATARVIEGDQEPLFVDADPWGAS